VELVQGEVRVPVSRQHAAIIPAGSVAAPASAGKSGAKNALIVVEVVAVVASVVGQDVIFVAGEDGEAVRELRTALELLAVLPAKAMPLRMPPAKCSRLHGRILPQMRSPYRIQSTKRSS
jgi:hypothetical protein